MFDGDCWPTVESVDPVPLVSVGRTIVGRIVVGSNAALVSDSEVDADI